MNLTNRLSLFFLTSLAAVLVGFSVTLYALASRYLHAQADQRLEAAIETLVASTEVFPDRIDWEPLVRRITLGEESGPEQIRWTVHAADGRLVDCSRNFQQPAEHTPGPFDHRWRLMAWRMRAGSFQPQPFDGWSAARIGSFSEVLPNGELPGHATPLNNRTFSDQWVLLTVGIEEQPIRTALNRLALWMGLLSITIWLIAAFGGRWMCRRALAPVFRMASSARSIRNGSNQGEFLDVARTGDELEDLGVAFNELLVDLRESLDRQQRFTGDASHQLRTPITALLAAVDVALRQERSPAEYQRVLGVVRRRGGQLTEIIETLLFLARADHASILPEPEHVEIAGWCRSWLEGWQDHPRSADIRFRDETGPLFMQTHPAMLGQILDNLLDNACKYSEPGTPIVVKLTREADRVVLAIEDRGCGIDRSDWERVFEPFFRSAPARWRGQSGVGLGLTVAKRLAAILGGRIYLASEAGQGSQFGIDLPFERTARRSAQHGRRDDAGEIEIDTTTQVTSSNLSAVYNPCAESADISLSDALDRVSEDGEWRAPT